MKIAPPISKKFRVTCHKCLYFRSLLFHVSAGLVQVFDQYVKTRAEEERKEKKNKLMQSKDEFRKMMEDAKLTARSDLTSNTH
jgi:hypothetical protein